MGGSQKTASSSYIRRRDVSPSAQLDPSSDESWSVRENSNMSTSEAECALVDRRALSGNSTRWDVKPDSLYEIQLKSMLLTLQVRLGIYLIMSFVMKNCFALSNLCHFQENNSYLGVYCL